MVVATHPAQALAGPRPTDRRPSNACSGAIGYTVNPTLLHTDVSVLPRRPRAQASWNYHLPACAAEPSRVNVSYNMNRLQRLDTTVPYIVTLNGDDVVDPDLVISPDEYEHPTYTADSVAARTPPGRAQRRHRGLRRRLPRVGIPRGRLPVRRRGGRQPGGRLVKPGSIASTRSTSTTAGRRRWSMRSASADTWPTSIWPTCRTSRSWLGSIRLITSAIRRDRSGPMSMRSSPSTASLSTAVSVMMLTQPRSLGYVFNPLTLFWCHDPSGALAAVIAEVHNTYGERHAYFIRPDSLGRAQTPKEFYVSPFYPVDGHYQMSLPEPDDQLAVTITLHRPDSRPVRCIVCAAPPVRCQRPRSCGWRFVIRCRPTPRAPASPGTVCACTERDFRSCLVPVPPARAPAPRPSRGCTSSSSARRCRFDCSRGTAARPVLRPGPPWC